ncbi:MAG TPA: hypothetical protein VEK08_14880 [Planctomycetota bacterium]|nr:hypothetical protein [Planctomycetota bacterium]
MHEQQTGNPVFDFRAAHRQRANALQNALLKLGLLHCAVSIVLLLITNAKAQALAPVAAIAGALLIFSGVAWGFYWRKKLRADFRREFGPK